MGEHRQALRGNGRLRTVGTPWNPESNKLRDLGAATVYEAQGAQGALDAGIKPLDPRCRMAGRPSQSKCGRRTT